MSDFVCVCMCAYVQQAPERLGQSDAVFEVVSLQREAERNNEERGRLASPTEEEEADEGMDVSLSLYISLSRSLARSCSLLPLLSSVVWSVSLVPSVELILF